MTGFAFFLGGLQRTEQAFNATVAQTMGMFLLLAVLSLTIPTVSQLWGRSTHSGVIAQSRGTAIIIIFSYLLWLVFQLRTHRDIFEKCGPKAPLKPSSKIEKGETFKRMATMGAATGAAVGKPQNVVYEVEDEEDTPQLTRIGAILTIIVSTTLLAFNTQFAANSIQGIMEHHNISEKFMGITVLPLLSNDLDAIMCGYKDKLDLTLSLTLHRSMQTALMVVPLIVLIAWGMHLDRMTLDFDGFSVAATFASIIIVTYVIQEGRSTWQVSSLSAVI